jgi:crotonobetainyl-CoA hydratase
VKVEEAKHWGLVNEVLPASDLMARARELADQLADGPPLIFTAIKDILRRTETLSEMEGLDLVRGLHSVQRVFESEDVKEGTRAFSEKRKPQWQGR